MSELSIDLHARKWKSIEKRKNEDGRGDERGEGRRGGGRRQGGEEGEGVRYKTVQKMKG